MDEHDIQDLRKARSLAGWSYLGIAMPLIGWILGAMSLSTSKYLEPRTEKAKLRVQGVRKLAWGGIVASFITVAMATTGGWLLYKAGVEELERQEAAQLEQERRNAEAATWQQNLESARRAEQQAQLQACLDDVNNNIEKVSKSVYTNDQAAVLLQYKEQYTRDCELRYPID